MSDNMYYVNFYYFSEIFDVFSGGYKFFRTVFRSFVFLTGGAMPLEYHEYRGQGGVFFINNFNSL